MSPVVVRSTYVCATEHLWGQVRASELTRDIMSARDHVSQYGYPDGRRETRFVTPTFKRATPAEQRQTIVTYASVPMVELVKGANSHIVAGKNMTLSFAHLDAHSYFPVHVHESMEQLMLILKGELDAILDGKLFRMKAGDVIFFPPGREHGASMLDEDCDIVDIFSPARVDYENKLKQALGGEN